MLLPSDILKTRYSTIYNENAKKEIKIVSGGDLIYLN